jgi:oxygen-independent coproporphyrinogen-3 oxidase
MPECLYIHIPFCIKKCIYCDFFSVSYDEPTANKYIGALCKELYMKKDTAGTLRSVYIGGGTPTLLSDKCFGQLFRCLKDNYNFSSDIEITVEANPGTIHGSKIDAIISLGVNRLSIGVQSFNDNELKTLGRIHDSEEALRSIETIKIAGMKDFSIDLMYGIPAQTMDSWQDSISNAVKLSPAHISAYELTPEEHTPFFKLLETHKISIPDEELVLEMYNHAIDYLAGFGYEHYEISNFALPEFKCIHNLNYWNRGEYIGAGAGAHSFIDKMRSGNIKDINAYIEQLNNRMIPETESTKLTSEETLKEFIFLGLRKTEGISISKSQETGLNIIDASGALINEGLVEIAKDYLRLTRKGIVISNTVIVKLFEKLGL